MEAAEKQLKPAAGITVWGIVLMVGGNTISVFAAYMGFMSMLTAGPFSSGGDGSSGGVFFGAVVSLIGFIMMLVGIHRFISRTDPKPVQPTEAEQAERLNRVDNEQNPDGTYKNAFTPSTPLSD
ncbi:hypothetical protein [Arthrobacter monumenti]